jgi:hypothetical protein
MKLKYCFAVSLFLFMQSDAINALSVVAEQEVELKGVILDWQDARIIDASIIIEGKNLRRSLESNNEGEFKISLPVGTYKLSVRHPVFKTYMIKKLKVSEATNSVLKVQLNIKTPLASGGKCPKGQLCL